MHGGESGTDGTFPRVVSQVADKIYVPGIENEKTNKVVYKSHRKDCERNPKKPSEKLFQALLKHPVFI